MTIKSRDDGILVKMVDNQNECDMIAAYHTVAIEQTLKALKFCMDLNMPIYFKDEEYFISDVTFTFGNESTDNIPAITVKVV